MSRFVPVLAALLLLAGCSDYAEMRSVAALTPAGGSPSLARAVAPDAALATLPAEAGAVVSVTERRDRERLQQVVTLGGEATQRGANQIRIEAAVREPGKLRRVTDEKIEAELAEQLPGIDMRPTSQVLANAAGPIGVATGRAVDGTRCAYAWQETTARTRRGWADQGTSGLFADDSADLSVRVRLCRLGVSEERLLAQVAGLRLSRDVAPSTGLIGAAGFGGGDALASAGYGANASQPASFAPTRSAETVAPAPRAIVRAAPVVRSPSVASAAPAARTEAAIPPAIVASPIPLPSGS